MNYWELRSIVKDIIPRRSILEDLEKHLGLVKEKGRKSNYSQFNLETKELTPIQRLLNKEEINSFLEVSLRAAHCPMPLNADLYDAVRCPFHCLYCFADSFRASLYTSFFDNSKHLGLRTCNPTFFRSELNKLLKGPRQSSSELQRAVNMRIPVRLGIRFEDFLPIEGKKKISLDFLSYLKDLSYPVMINTKSSLIGREDYVRVLSENKGGSAVHITAISANDELNKLLEPGAPSFFERIRAIKSLTDEGIRVVARIEPFMVFVNDKEGIEDWVVTMREMGVDHVTLDTYSWFRGSGSEGIKDQINVAGIDFERMFLLMSDAQWLGSLLLSKFMEFLRERGFSCSTFDFGNVPSNDQDICCEVGDLFLSKGAGFSYGNNLSAIRFICKQEGKPVIWEQYDEWVESKGGWLSETLRQEVFQSWNLLGSPKSEAYFPDWAKGIELCGTDWGGFKAWRYRGQTDFREEMLENLARM